MTADYLIELRCARCGRCWPFIHIGQGACVQMIDCTWVCSCGHVQPIPNFSFQTIHGIAQIVLSSSATIDNAIAAFQKGVRARGRVDAVLDGIDDECVRSKIRAVLTASGNRSSRQWTAIFSLIVAMLSWLSLNSSCQNSIDVLTGFARDRKSDFQRYIRAVESVDRKAGPSSKRTAKIRDMGGKHASSHKPEKSLRDDPAFGMWRDRWKGHDSATVSRIIRRRMERREC